MLPNFRTIAVIAPQVIVLLAVCGLASAQPRARRPLASADISSIARLLMLEDTRRFDAAALRLALASPHPEVRRRAALAVGRIGDARGSALLTTLRADPDPEVAATVAFSAGQLKDQAATPWLAAALQSARTPMVVGREAAIALGKIQGPAARAALSRYLTTVPASARATPVIGEALLSLGRFTADAHLAPLTRWVSSPDVEIRWRATWALYRPRSPAAFPHLLRLSQDESADVRFWAVRGLAPPPRNPSTAEPGRTPAGGSVPAGVFDGAAAAARLRDAARDVDRRVRTEALRALAQYDDNQSFAIVVAALDSSDSWLSVSAVEALARYPGRPDVVPWLIAAAAPGRPLSMRMSALAPLTTLSPPAALDLAGQLAAHTNSAARAVGRQALTRLGSEGRARLQALPEAASESTGTAAPGAGLASPSSRTLAEYRALVERWIVPDYLGAPKPRALWDTPRGTIELELYPGDAPLGVDYFVRLVESGELAGTPFTRVVPNFVAQQRAVRSNVTVRDEVNRRGLVSGNLSWASAGLDTGRPGYTLGSTPQPHNEGNFTALGRVVSGMDVVDRLELGDLLLAARLQR